MSTESGNTSTELVDLNASMDLPPSNVSVSDGSPQEETSETSLLQLINASDINTVEQWSELSDFKKIRLVNGDSIPGYESFTELMSQSIDKIDGSIELTKIQIVVMNDIMDGKLRSGHLYDLPMTCTGEACIIVSTCPYTKAKSEYPVGNSCPVERSQIANWVQQYLGEINESDLPPSTFSLVKELVSVHIAQSRIAAVAAKDPNPMMEVSVGFDREGNVVNQKRESPLNKERTTLAKSMERLMKALHLTREQHKKNSSSLDTLSSVCEQLTRKADEVCERYDIIMEGGSKDDVPSDSEQGVSLNKSPSFFDSIKGAKTRDEKNEKDKLESNNKEAYDQGISDRVQDKDQKLEEIQPIGRTEYANEDEEVQI